MEHNKLAIVIANYNGKNDTLDCLKSLGSSDFKDFFVVLADDCSPVKEKAVDADLLEKAGITPDFEMEVIKTPKNLGFAGANNVGIKKALEYAPEYVMLLNNDTIVEANALSVLMNSFTESKLIVTPVILQENDRRTVWAAGLEYNKEFMIYSNGQAGKNIETVKGGKCDALSFCACIMPAVVFEEVGMLDESYFMYDEDVDYCMRLKAAGYSFYCNDKAIIHHKAGAAGIGQKDTGLYYGLRNECYIREKYLDGGRDYNNRLLSENSRRLRLKKLLNKTNIHDEYWVVQAVNDWKNGISGPKDFSELDIFDVYVCETAYHFLITVIKAMNSRRLTKVILCTGNIFDESMIARIKDSGVFQEVIDYRELDEFDRKLDYSASMLKRHDDLQRQLDKRVEWKHKNNYEYYLYNDVGIMGKWLNSHRIKYHLIEDAMDTYTMPAYKALNYVESPVKKMIRRRLGAGFYCFGESLYYKSIEVNSKQGLLLKSNKVIEVPKKQLFDGLTKSQKDRIIRIFLPKERIKRLEKQIDDMQGEDKVLLLTQPFASDKMMSYEMHERLYKDLVNQVNGNNLVIKPHPRDDFDYNRIFPDAIIFDEKTVPIEVIGFMDGINFKKAVTVCSTSIKGITFCNEKIDMGIDYLKDYFKRDTGFESPSQFVKDMKNM